MEEVLALIDAGLFIVCEKNVFLASNCVLSVFLEFRSTHTTTSMLYLGLPNLCNE